MSKLRPLKLSRLTDPLQSMIGEVELPEKVKNNLALSGSNNELTQKQQRGVEMGNALGRGIPGYEVTGKEEPLAEITEQLAAQQQPKQKF